MAEDNGFCDLVNALLKGMSRDAFVGSVARLCHRVGEVCRPFLAAEALFGGGDVRVDELPEDLQRVIREASSSTPPVGGAGWLTRTFLGVRASGTGGDALVTRFGGVGEWVCEAFLKGVEALGKGVRCLEGGEGRAEALITLSRSVNPYEAGNLRDALAGISEAVLNLLPGVSRYVTLAWLLRFAPIPSVREGLRGCGLRDIDSLERLLREFSPALFDLSECRLYPDVKEVPRKLLRRGDYLLATGSVVVRGEGLEGRDYVIYGEEVPASPIYGFINAVTEGWVRAEEILFGTSPTLKVLEGFIEANLRDSKLRLSTRGRKVTELVLRGREFKVTTVPGKDEFSPEDKALVLELTQAVMRGLMNASVGWDGVRRGNAVVNRYAVRFKPTYALRVSKRLQTLVANEVLR